jgi:hypothetical protein
VGLRTQQNLAARRIGQTEDRSQGKETRFGEPWTKSAEQEIEVTQLFHALLIAAEENVL